jgi:hypothetical protein
VPLKTVTVQLQGVSGEQWLMALAALWCICKAIFVYAVDRGTMRANYV